MRVAVTGSSGFLGKRLVSKLLSVPDIEIVAFTSNVDMMKCDFQDKNVEIYNRNDFYGDQLNNIDVFVNCAFPRNNDGNEMAKGLGYISNIFQVAKIKNVGAMINISSQSVYSQIRTSFADEKEPICLESVYAVGKYASELLTNNMFRDIKHTNIRMASLIGPGLEQRVVNKLVNNALKEKMLYVSEDNMRFGFMDVDDAVEALIKIIHMTEIHWEEVYNVGVQESVTLVDMANSIKQELRKRSLEVSIKLSKGTNVLNTSLNCSNFNSTFNFRPQYTLADTIKKIIDAKI